MSVSGASRWAGCLLSQSINAGVGGETAKSVVWLVDLADYIRWMEL